MGVSTEVKPFHPHIRGEEKRSVTKIQKTQPTPPQFLSLSNDLRNPNAHQKSFKPPYPMFEELSLQNPVL
jgi:hypothetical protein